MLAWVLAILTGITLLLMTWLFRYWTARPDQFPPVSTLARSRQAYVGPKLQENAPRDLKQWRDTEDEVLTGYGWIDRDHGVVRIPITRAIELVSQKGLPDKFDEGGSTP